MVYTSQSLYGRGLGGIHTKDPHSFKVCEETSIPTRILGRHLVGFVQDGSSDRCKIAAFGFIEKMTLKLEALQTSKAHTLPQNAELLKKGEEVLNLVACS